MILQKKRHETEDMKSLCDKMSVLAALFSCSSLHAEFYSDEASEKDQIWQKGEIIKTIREERKIGHGHGLQFLFNLNICLDVSHSWPRRMSSSPYIVEL